MKDRDWKSDRELAHKARHENDMKYFNEILDALFYWGDKAEELHNGTRNWYMRQKNKEHKRTVELLGEHILKIEEQNETLSKKFTRMLKCAIESRNTVETLYRIIQRGDLTSRDIEEAETAYKNLIRFIKVESLDAYL